MYIFWTNQAKNYSKISQLKNITLIYISYIIYYEQVTNHVKE